MSLLVLSLYFWMHISPREFVSSNFPCLIVYWYTFIGQILQGTCKTYRQSKLQCSLDQFWVCDSCQACSNPVSFFLQVCAPVQLERYSKPSQTAISKLQCSWKKKKNEWKRGSSWHMHKSFSHNKLIQLQSKLVITDLDFDQDFGLL